MLGAESWRCCTVIVSALTLAGCGYPRLAALANDAPPLDGQPSPAQDGQPGPAQDGQPGLGQDVGFGDAAVCFGTSIVQVCLAAPPSQMLMISGATTIDTAGPGCNEVVTDAGYCVMAATDITIAATLRASGPRPLVLVASGSITVAAGGLIDVGSHRGADPEFGAGADPTTCGSGQAPTASSGSGITSGGGAGGSFVGLGASGGDGDQGGTGGVSAQGAASSQLRGGCPGQDGAGSPSSGTSGNFRGHGGGAVFLIATHEIDIQGNINATGEGGGGGARISTPDGGCGGGGGGSGGMIGFDAPVIRGSGLILASGGSGGGGGGERVRGADGVSPSTTSAAMGGAGARNNQTDNVRVGGDGGAGSFATGGPTDGERGTNDHVGTGGGGGGGGGTGVIKAPATANLGANISPAMTTP